MFIYLMRHGPYSPAASDPEEGLSLRGEEVVRGMGRELKSLGVFPDAVFASPKKRALQTAALVAQALAYPPAGIQEGSWLKPMAPPDETLARLRGLDGDNVLLVGHLPNLRLVASLLLSGGEDLDLALEPGSACCLEAPRPSAPARLHWLLRPR